jgi:NADH-quinone oxidoreductase subunit C
MSQDSAKPPAPPAAPAAAPAPTAPPAGPPALTRLLLERFGEQVLSHHAQHGDETVVIGREGMLAVFGFLKSDPRCAFEMMMDLTAVDYLPRTPRFELVVHLKSLSRNHRLRVKIPVAEQACEVDSIHGLWVAADWYERECHEMYGIVFKGHPNLAPLLLYDGFEGHPLRKDYPKGLQQPLVPMRPVKERYDYGERFQPVQHTSHAAVATDPTEN